MATSNADQAMSSADYYPDEGQQNSSQQPPKKYSASRSKRNAHWRESENWFAKPRDQGKNNNNSRQHQNRAYNQQHQHANDKYGQDYDYYARQQQQQNTGYQPYYDESAYYDASGYYNYNGYNSWYEDPYANATSQQYYYNYPQNRQHGNYQQDRRSARSDQSANIQNYDYDESYNESGPNSYSSHKQRQPIKSEGRGATRSRQKFHNDPTRNLKGERGEDNRRERRELVGDGGYSDNGAPSENQDLQRRSRYVPKATAAAVQDPVDDSGEESDVEDDIDSGDVRRDAQRGRHSRGRMKGGRGGATRRLQQTESLNKLQPKDVNQNNAEVRTRASQDSASAKIHEEKEKTHTKKSTPKRSTKPEKLSDYDEMVAPKPSTQSVRKPAAQIMESQRESLIEHLRQCTYECMVCCSNIRHDKAVWSCDKCFHIFHLYCIRKWARSASSILDESSSGWRCPACQNVVFQVPSQYTCFCNKVTDPEYSVYDTPHSCGGVCGKKRPASCPHPCNILCHPGPCPPCQATTTRKCDCGKSQQTVRCGQMISVKCNSVCERSLNCAQHTCQLTCHAGACPPCDVLVTQQCHCGKESRSVTCGTSDFFAKTFSCAAICDRELSCGNHRCVKPCHAGACDKCSLSPTHVTHCPCGQVSLDAMTPRVTRTACTDPVPVCDNICNKPIGCGPSDKPHLCARPCHEGPCGPCDDQTLMWCRCRAMQRTVPCRDVLSMADGLRCAKRCNKKRACGRHKCAQNCCTDTEHRCDVVCGRKLSCGLHKCEELCHAGNCPACYNVSFDELRCHCGATVTFPPIPCGTRPPECHKPCSRQHACDHAVSHPCHSEDTCPPCAMLVEKLCMGGHEMRKNVPCYLTDVSCGKACGKPFSCGYHSCKQLCHKGECTQATQCDQPCPVPRDVCGHACNQPCHAGWPCPQTVCKAEVTIYCKCQRLSEKVPCYQATESNEDWQRLVALRLSDETSDDRVNLSELSKASARKLKTLSCDAECARIERQRQLAEAFEIQNPDLTNKPAGPQYSAFLKTFAKKNSKMVADVEKALGELVYNVGQSKQPIRRHAFPRMNREQRQMVHELAEAHGCEGESYDEEPNRNVVVTAQKGKCMVPSVSLTSLTLRESKPRAPVPIPAASKIGDIRRAMADSDKRLLSDLDQTTSSSTGAAQSSSNWSYASSVATETKAAAKEPLIDYFDMMPL